MTWMFFAPLELRRSAKIWTIGVSKTSDHIQIKIKMPNPGQELPASFKAPSQDLKDMDVLCTYKIKIELKFETLVYQRAVTITKSIASCLTPVRTSQRPMT